PNVTLVVVADDGSKDATASIASAAGAHVLRAARPRGKGSVLESALRRLPPARVWILADGDLGVTAGELAPVIATVLAGEADLAIALPPPQGGGFGLVKTSAGAAIRWLSGFRATAPLSGQRVLTGAAMRAVRPLAPGFGVETAMTVDAVRAGMTVVEVPAPLRHRATGRDVAGFAHRARQGIDIAAALGRRIGGRSRVTERRSNVGRERFDR
ncbi:MAG: glycosyltransferase, partial [Actinomycetota bacterium]